MVVKEMRNALGSLKRSVLGGESFADALEQHPGIFPPMYVALVRIGEASGSLGQILEMLARERSRAKSD